MYLCEWFWVKLYTFTLIAVFHISVQIVIDEKR